MAEFGIKATQLADPRAAGSQPIAGVQGAVEDTTLPTAGLKIAETFALDFTKRAIQTESNAVLAELTNGLASLSQAVEMGSIPSSAASTRARSLMNRALQQSGGNPDIVKSATDIGKSFFGMTNIETAMSATEEAAKREAAFNTAVVDRLVKAGFPVSPNPTPEEMAAYKELDNSIQSSQSKLERDKAILEYGASQYRFNQQQAEDILKNKTNEYISKNLEPSMNALSTQAVAIKQKIASGYDPQLGMQELEQTAQFFKGQMLQIAGGNPQYVNDINRYVDDYTKTLIQSFDPKVTAQSLADRIKIQESQDRILLMSNLDVRAASAVLAITPNNPLLQAELNPQMLAAVAPLALSFDPTQRNTQNINFADKQIRSGVYKTARTSIDAVMKEMNNPNGDKTRGPQHMDNMVNNLLSQGAALAQDPNIKPTDAQDMVNFLASDEFRKWRETGNLNPQAMEGAQRMFSQVYLRQIQQGIIDKLDQTVTALPQNSSSLVSGIIGNKETPPLKYIDLFDVKFENNGISFVPRKVPGADLLQMKEAANYVKDLEKTQKVINVAIRAGANVSRAKDLKTYWEENKHNILPVYFGAGDAGLKVGDVVNGKKYIGGSVKSKYSWEAVNGGGN